MDTAVALVQAYLRLNGYFTVTEYPVFELGSGGGIRTATDLDLLAFRFPGAGRPVIGESGGATVYRPDPALGDSIAIPRCSWRGKGDGEKAIGTTYACAGVRPRTRQRPARTSR